MDVNRCTWLLSVFLLLPVDLVSLSCILSTPPHLLPAPHLQHRAASSQPPSLHFTLFTSAHLAPCCQAQSSVEEPSHRRLTSPLSACLGSAHGTVKKRNPECEREIFAKFLYLSVFYSWFPVEALAMWSGWLLLDLLVWTFIKVTSQWFANCQHRSLGNVQDRGSEKFV